MNGKKFSLLRTEEEQPRSFPVLYDLSVDRAMYAICPDRKRVDYFLDVLQTPLRKRENVLYRQQIFRDLVSIPGLFDEMKLLFTRYDKIKSDWHEMKLSSLPSASISADALLDHTYGSLKVTSIFPLTIVSFFSSAAELLEKYPIASDGLIAIRDYCREMLENDSLNEIVRIAQLFRYNSPDHYTFDVCVTLDHTLRARSAEICGIRDFEEKSKLAQSLEKLLKKKNAEEECTVEPTDNSFEDTVILLNEALSHIDTALTRITGEVYEILYGLSRELWFYEVALTYHAHVTSLGLPLLYPEILPEEDDTVVLRGVYDLVLASGGHGKDGIVPNDGVIEGTDGIIVKGLTDTGKTVFLRSVGAAQLFGQAGLPVLAEEARLSIRSAFFSHFSSAEEEFLTGDAMGRFDQEAKEISAIVDRLEPHAMVYLNETFQTTSYKEGTDAIYHILQILPRIGAKYLFVTHLTRLFSMMDGKKVCLMETNDEKKYKLKRIG